MADNRQINEKYQKIGENLIATEPVLEYIKQSDARIVFLESEHEPKVNDRKTLGKCEKVATKYKWGIPADFTITLYEPNIEGLTEKQIEILILHELLHVGIKEDIDFNEAYFVQPHDLEDFKYIIDKYGTDWDTVIENE